MSKVNMRDMFAAGVHFGHRTRFWDPKMGPYIFGKRNDLHIIDLEKTLSSFEDAMNFISKTASTSNKILFVGTKRAASLIIKEQAVRCGMPYVDHRWLGGMLTNYKTIRKSIKRLVELEELEKSGKFNSMIKKEALKLTREAEKLKQSIGGIKDMIGLPDAIFVIDVGFEKIAVKEANKLRIPIVGIVDTNNTPDGIDHIIPGNDDSLRAIELYVSAVADTILQAKQEIADQAAARDDSYVEVSKEPSSGVPVASVKIDPATGNATNSQD